MPYSYLLNIFIVSETYLALLEEVHLFRERRFVLMKVSNLY